mmetsp:Transcript_11705/g.33117  ORF Transcript_11705/g.33117 Transcript_11705/m.33117 type:complete len:80 (+) Transcript_11705:180-419(+)
MSHNEGTTSHKFAFLAAPSPLSSSPPWPVHFHGSERKKKPGILHPSVIPVLHGRGHVQMFGSRSWLIPCCQEVRFSSCC